MKIKHYVSLWEQHNDISRVQRLAPIRHRNPLCWHSQTSCSQRWWPPIWPPDSKLCHMRALYRFLPPCIPPEPVQTGQVLSPSTYGLTWLYHIIILAVPSVCPVVLSSVQTCSPVINPSVHCPTLLHAVCVDLVLHKCCCRGEHLSRWVGRRCKVSGV